MMASHSDFYVTTFESLYLSLKMGMLVCILVNNGHAEVIRVPTTASTVSVVREYTLFTHTQNWNTARRICRSSGGHLAKINSPERLDMIRQMSAKDKPWVDDWDKAWTGLHRNAAGNLLFDGLSECTFFNIGTSGMNIFHDEHDYEMNDNNRCFTVHENEYVLERKNCEETHKFICERKLAGGECKFKKIDIQPIVSLHTSLSCERECNRRDGCFMAGNYSFDTVVLCIMLAVPTGSKGMFRKLCPPRFLINNTVTIDYKQDMDTPPECEASPVKTSGVKFQSVSTQLLPSSSFNTDANSVTFSSETIMVSPPVVNITSTDTVHVTEVITEPLSCSTTTSFCNSTVTVTIEGTEISRETVSCPGINAPVTEIIQATQTISNFMSCSPFVVRVTLTETLINTQTLKLYPESYMTATDTTAESVSACVIQVTSTILMTSVTNCSDHVQTPTPSYAEHPWQLQPATVTIYQHRSCICDATPLLGDISITPNSAGVIYPSSQPTRFISHLVNDYYYQTTICKTYNFSGSDKPKMGEIRESIVNKLTLVTKNLSKTIREKTSAPDNRPSSKSIGFTAVLFVIVPLLFLVLLDFQKIVVDLRNSFIRIRNTVNP